MNKLRCFGNKPNQDLYAQYHDTEWGKPSHDDRHLFEMLILEGAQAGLTWETILKRRSAYQKVFHNFDPQKIAAMSDQELESLCSNPTIIRNRLKIFSARKNAHIFLTIQKEFGSFDTYLWRFVNNEPIINNWQSLNEIAVKTPQSDALSRDLKKRGMSFVGSTIIYAYMQAIGMVNDHIACCFIKQQSKKMAE